MKYVITPGASSQSVQFHIYKDDGTANTSLVYNSASLVISYKRDNGTLTSITLVTLASDTAAYSSGGFVHIGGGLYRLDLPNAAVASGASNVQLVVTEATDIRGEPCQIELYRKPVVSSAGYTQSDLWAVQSDASMGVKFALFLYGWSAETSPGTQASAGLYNLATAYYSTSKVPASGDWHTSTQQTADMSTIGGWIADLTTAIVAVPANVWNRLTSAITTVGSIGKLLVDRIDAAISSRHPSGAAVKGVTAATAYYVSTSGNDSNDGLTPASAKLTLSAAQTAATAPAAIIVMPGTYTGTNLGKNGVDWYIAPHTTINNPTNGQAVWADGDADMTFTVTGEGIFTSPGAASKGVTLTGTNSKVRIECESISAGDVCVHSLGDATALTVTAKSDVTSTGYDAIWCQGGGRIEVNADTVQGQDNAIEGGDQPGTINVNARRIVSVLSETINPSECTVTVKADEIVSTAVATKAAIYYLTANSVIEANRIVGYVESPQGTIRNAVIDSTGYSGATIAFASTGGQPRLENVLLLTKSTQTYSISLPTGLQTVYALGAVGMTKAVQDGVTVQPGYTDTVSFTELGDSVDSVRNSLSDVSGKVDQISGETNQLIGMTTGADADRKFLPKALEDSPTGTATVDVPAIATAVRTELFDADADAKLKLNASGQVETSNGGSATVSDQDKADIVAGVRAALSGSTLTIRSNVLEDGTVTLYAGGDYTEANDNAIVFTITDWSGPSLDGADVSLRFLRTSVYKRSGSSGAAELEVTAQAEQVDTTVTLSFDITSEQSESIVSQFPVDASPTHRVQAFAVGIKRPLVDVDGTVRRLIGATQ